MKVENCPAGPEVDAAVARALGLDVLGIIPCCPDPETFGYLVGYEEQGNIPRPVYLRDCACEFKEPNDVDYFGHHAGCLDVVHDYSTDIAAAWEVHRAACAMLFSKRRAYFRAIQEQTRLESGALVAWPDVLMALIDVFPEAICRAFLKAKGVEEIG
jgi:hypothetical protein